MMGFNSKSNKADRLGLSAVNEDTSPSLVNLDRILRSLRVSEQNQNGQHTLPPKPLSLQKRLDRNGVGPDALGMIPPDLLGEIRRTLIRQETAYQCNAAEETFSSVWAHSCRVGRIARHIAKAEGWNEELALLAGLLHDTGKFACGKYRDGDVPEEKYAVRFTERLLSGTVYERWIPMISQAILSAYFEGEPTNDLGRVVYDADSLDKMGHMGIVQFFTKQTLRRRFLDNDTMVRISIELTYAHHAPDTLKTATGRSLARERSLRTRRFYTELLEEWSQMGLGAFTIVEENIAGIVCILVVPCACACGGRIRLESDIRDVVKCSRSVVMTYGCEDCGFENVYYFCLPNIDGLPPKP
ncbi:hypothetical protein B2D07_12265 [Desulfococcus multivorans]|uniref:Metal dependent phosphohydrolase n=2 Tax=Desulfococcus multivorans TaxID=897 RepID=S7V1V3_DESML|nr:hypothetical protein B2D07_12265 [Desulfococcus multivorans]EPR40479.1 metal dependent phosphohydrolase [Desulfococcus multivorans DSM 2059]SKA26383.1 HD superfamily phosphodieaserase, includes HD domain of RNase Y [Desulfococcus multivorans DSM 2059]